MTISPTGSIHRPTRSSFARAVRSILSMTTHTAKEVLGNLEQSSPIIGMTSLAVRSTIGILLISTSAVGRLLAQRNNGCEYSFTNHTGRDTSSYCSEEDGALELFANITTQSSAELGSLPLLDQAKAIHRAMLICLSHGPRRSLGWFSGATPYNSSNPIFSGMFDVTCPNLNGTILTNTIVTPDYTQNLELSFICQQGYPVGVLKSKITLSSTEDCNTAEDTFYIFVNSLETGISGTINGNMQNCSSIDSAAAQAFLNIPPVEAVYNEEERCWALIPAPPSPSPSTSPSPFPFPSSSPSPYPSPTVQPPIPTPTVQPPVPAPTVQPPVPAPTVQPPVPAPAPVPQKNTDHIEWSDPMMIIIFVVAGIFLCVVTTGCCYCYNRKRGLVLIGTGPAMARENDSEPHEEAESARKAAEARATAAATAALTANKAATDAKEAENADIAVANANIAQTAAEASKRAAAEAERAAIIAEENAKKAEGEHAAKAEEDARKAKEAADTAKDSADQAKAAAAAAQASALQAESSSKAKKRHGKGGRVTDPLLINERREDGFVTIWGEEDPVGPPPSSPPVSDGDLFNLCGGRRKKEN